MFPAMLFATRKVRRQLADDPTVVRWASVVAGSREFWTITVWRSRHDMQEFMRSGAHDDIMWLFAKLLRSFWLMRWRPTTAEIGSWNGLRLSGEAPVVTSSDDVRRDGLEQALAHLPRLAEAMGPDGRAAYEYSAFARRRREEVGSAAGLVVNLRLRRTQSLRAVIELRRLKAAASEAGAVRAVVGAGRPGEAYLLGVWPESAALDAFTAAPAVAGAVERWGERMWLAAWVPENEFGHWDGLRVRRRRRPVISMPESVARLGD